LLTHQSHAAGSGFQGTFDPNYIPSNEAIAVGPHPDDEGVTKYVYMLCFVNTLTCAAEGVHHVIGAEDPWECGGS